MNEFLNPKSMVTPGAVGAMVMLITNSVCTQFPEITPRWTAFLLSFLFATFVLSSAEIALRAKIVFWLVNSLIIFSVSVGTNNIGKKAESSAPEGGMDLTSFLRIGISDAAAQASDGAIFSSSGSTNIKPQDLKSQNLSLRKNLQQQTQMIEDLQIENKKLKEQQAASVEQAPPTNSQTPSQKPFFKQW